MEKIDNLDEENNGGEDSNYTSTTSLPSISRVRTRDQFKSNFQESYTQIEERMKQYVEKINNYFYTEMFDSLYIKLKELYDDKYKKYIKANDEYHSNIKENEFILENEDTMDQMEKMAIQNIIECLKEEQKDQIDQILDECNKNINTVKNDYIRNLFEKNIGVQLIEERLKLDVYSMINNAFY